MVEYMPACHMNTLYSRLITFMTGIAGALLLFTASAHAQALPGYQYQVVCPDQPQPKTFSCDGFPAFNSNHCRGHNVYSTDGFNTFGTPSPGAFHTYPYPAGGSGGYICRE